MAELPDPNTQPQGIATDLQSTSRSTSRGDSYTQIQHISSLSTSTDTKASTQGKFLPKISSFINTNTGAASSKFNATRARKANSYDDSEMTTPEQIHHRFNLHQPNAPQKCHHSHQTEHDRITELKIRNAVLENELKHNEAARKQAVNASIIIAQTLGAALSQGGVGVDFECLELLMRGGSGMGAERGLSEAKYFSENAQREPSYGADLRREIDDEGTSSCIGSSTVQREQNSQRSSRFPDYGDDQLGKAERLAKDQARDVSQKQILSEGASDGDGSLEHRLGGLKGAYEQDKPLNGDGSKSYGPQQLGVFAIAEETGRNDPSDLGTEHHTAAATVLDDRVFENYDSEETPKNFSVDDVGMQSLDEVLGDKDIKTEDEPSTFDPELMSKIKALNDLPDPSPPEVLITGFEMSRASVGGTYGPINSQGGSLVGHKTVHDSTIPSYSFADQQQVASGQQQGLWKTALERQFMLELQFMDSKSRYTPLFFKHGVQYIPAAEDRNKFRTVQIGNLPFDVQLKDVLARVRGGYIITASLLDLVKLTGGMVALVTFAQEDTATSFVQYTSRNPIRFYSKSTESGDVDKGTVAAVTLISTPSYPSPRNLLEYNPAQPKQSRIIGISPFSEEFPIHMIRHKIACDNNYRRDSLVDIYADEEGTTLFLEFSGIKAAGSAFGILNNWRLFRELQMHSTISFVPDTCAGEVEELATPVPVRFPFNGSCQRKNDESSLIDLMEESKHPSMEISSVVQEGPDQPIIPQSLEPLGNPKTTISSQSERQDDKILGIGTSPPYKQSSTQLRCSNNKKIYKPPVGLAGSQYAHLSSEVSDQPTSLDSVATINRKCLLSPTPENKEYIQLEEVTESKGSRRSGDSMLLADATTQNQTLHQGDSNNLPSISLLPCSPARTLPLPALHPYQLPGEAVVPEIEGLGHLPGDPNPITPQNRFQNAGYTSPELATAQRPNSHPPIYTVNYTNHEDNRYPSAHSTLSISSTSTTIADDPGNTTAILMPPAKDGESSFVKGVLRYDPFQARDGDGFKGSLLPLGGSVYVHNPDEINLDNLSDDDPGEGENDDADDAEDGNKVDNLSDEEF